jgi:hypothetical protein
MTDTQARLDAAREMLRGSLNIPPADCTNHCGDGPCDCSGEYRVQAYSKESVDAALTALAAELERVTAALDDLQQRWLAEAQRTGGTMGTCLESVAHQLAACRIAALAGAARPAQEGEA